MKMKVADWKNALGVATAEIIRLREGIRLRDDHAIAISFQSGRKVCMYCHAHVNWLPDENRHGGHDESCPIVTHPERP